MNRLLKYSVVPALLLLLAACKKDSDPAFSEPADVRVQKTLTAFQETIAGAPNGWKAVLYPKGGKGFSYWMKFDNANRVTMVSDFNTTSATTPKTSSYRLKALQQPSLLFDTYNYIHLPADPTGSISGGNDATGLASDFEFMLGTSLIDTLAQKAPFTQMTLTGRFNGVDIVMTKASAAEETAYNAGGLNTLMSQITAYLNANPFLFLRLDNQQLQVSMDVDAKSFALGWDANGSIGNSTSPFAFTLTGIVLQKPVEYNGKKIYELTWDEHAQVLYATVDGAKVIIEVSAAPILPLHLLLGSPGAIDIVVPYATTFPGWSADFQARRAQAAAAIQAGPYAPALRLDLMDFEFNSQTKVMTVYVIIYQGANGFLATFTYNYTKTSAGVFKFTKANPYTNNIAVLIEDYMVSLLAQRLDVDQFTISYFNDPANGVLGQFKSVEHPDFTFTGTIE